MYIGKRNFKHVNFLYFDIFFTWLLGIIALLNVRKYVRPY